MDLEFFVTPSAGAIENRIYRASGRQRAHLSVKPPRVQDQSPSDGSIPPLCSLSGGKKSAARNVK